MYEIEGSTVFSEMVWKSSRRTMQIVLQFGRYTRMILLLLSTETKRANSDRDKNFRPGAVRDRYYQSYILYECIPLLSKRH